MRKGGTNSDAVKDRLTRLKDMYVEMRVNKGRKHIVSYHGKVISLYSETFLFEVSGNEFVDKLSISYADVLTKDVKFYPLG